MSLQSLIEVAHKNPKVRCYVSCSKAVKLLGAICVGTTSNELETIAKLGTTMKESLNHPRPKNICPSGDPGRQMEGSFPRTRPSGQWPATLHPQTWPIHGLHASRTVWFPPIECWHGRSLTSFTRSRYDV